MAMASVRTAVTANPGNFLSCRAANRMSAHIDSRVGHTQISRLALFEHRQIAKCNARLSLRLDRTQALANQVIDALLKVKAHFFREIVKELAAAETVGDPVHRNLPLARRTTCPDSRLE